MVSTSTSAEWLSFVNNATMAGVTKDNCITFDVGTGFQIGVNPGVVYSLAQQADGKIIAVGNFTSYNGTAATRVARLNTDGSLDSSFNTGTGFNDSPTKVLVHPSGKILVSGGYFDQYNGTAINGRLAMLNPDGSLDTTFMTNYEASYSFDTMACAFVAACGTEDAIVKTNGDIYILGTQQGFQGPVFRLNSSGITDSTFATNMLNTTDIGESAMYVDNGIMLLRSDGSIFIQYDHTNRLFNSDGSMVGGMFISETYSDGLVNTILANDHIIFSGFSSNFPNYTSANILMFDTSGDVDLSFSTNKKFTLNSIASESPPNFLLELSNGNILAGGNFEKYDGAAIPRLVQLTTSGTLDSGFTSVAIGQQIYCGIELSNGKILVGGSFSLPKNGIMLLNPDGTSAL